jgi:hypothetical protein
MVHGDRDDTAERQAADVGAVDPERLHRRQERRGVIVARRLLGRGVAVAVAGIVERDRAARLAKMVELWPPDGLVGTDSVEEDEGSRLAAADLLVTDVVAVAGAHFRHASHLGREPPAALASRR